MACLLFIKQENEDITWCLEPPTLREQPYKPWKAGLAAMLTEFPNVFIFDKQEVLKLLHTPTLQRNANPWKSLVKNTSKPEKHGTWLMTPGSAATGAPRVPH